MKEKEEEERLCLIMSLEPMGVDGMRAGGWDVWWVWGAGMGYQLIIVAE